MSLSPVNPFAQLLSTLSQPVSSQAVVSSKFAPDLHFVKEVHFDLLSLGQPAPSVPEGPPPPAPTPAWLKPDGEDRSTSSQLVAYQYVSEDGVDDSLEVVLALADYFADTWLAESSNDNVSASDEVNHE